MEKMEVDLQLKAEIEKLLATGITFEQILNDGDNGLAAKLTNHICWGCGSEFENRDTHCSQCGRQLHRRIDYDCEKCGTFVERHDKYCTGCGEKVEINTSNWFTKYGQIYQQLLDLSNS